jgi:hypothetical protein
MKQTTNTPDFTSEPATHLSKREPEPAPPRRRRDPYSTGLAIVHGLLSDPPLSNREWCDTIARAEAW